MYGIDCLDGSPPVNVFFLVSFIVIFKASFKTKYSKLFTFSIQFWSTLNRIELDYYHYKPYVQVVSEDVQGGKADNHRKL